MKADEIDSTFADLQFRLGRCFWALGEYEKSKQRYVQAREMDTLRFRADIRINDIIRDIASDKTADGVYFVDAMNIFEAKSPRSITGEELFYEHVHMNFSGNYLLAQLIYQQVQNILPERIRQNKANASEIPSEAECARYLAYTDWEKYKITNTLLKDFIKRPPFTNQLYHDKRVGELEKTIQDTRDSFAADVLERIGTQYNWAVQENSSDWLLFWKYGEFLEEQNKYGEAIRMFRSVLKFVPQNFEAFAKVGFLLGNLGDFSGAVENNQEALRLYPFSSITHYNLGLAYQFQNDLEKAVEHYSRAIQLKPDDAQAYNNLGGVLYHLKRTDKAIEIYRRGLEQVPDDRDMNYNLGLIFRLEGRRSEAVEMFKKALEIDPKYEKAIQELQAIEK